MRKLKFKRLCIVFSVCFLLIGCIVAPKVMITPHELPQAVIGKNYYTTINIRGGSGPILERGFLREIYPKNSGLEIIFPEINGYVEYNYLAVKGIPKITGDIKVVIKGKMSSVFWYVPASYFEESYTIQVSEAEE